MKKRNLIALLMAVCMMFSLLPVNAIAVGDEGTVPAEETLLSEKWKRFRAGWQHQPRRRQRLHSGHRR